MNSPNFPHKPRAFTLLEMTVVIMILISLISTGLFVSKKLDEWKLGRAASESLRSVYAAQRMFLADNPTKPVSEITAADVVPYLVSHAAALPSVTALNGSIFHIKVNVSPPIVVDGADTLYDPSNNNQDSLWDVGE